MSKLGEWLKGKIGNKNKKEKKGTAENKTVLIAPFLGSALNSTKKEAMTGIVLTAMEEKGKKHGDKIYISEFWETVKKMDKIGNLPTAFKLFPDACWNAFQEMGKEGLLIIAAPEGENEAYVIVTEKLTKLLKM